MSDPRLTSRTALAPAFGLLHWGLLVLVQGENLGASGWWRLPLMQTQNALAAVCVALLAWLAARAVWSRVVFFAAYAGLTALVVVDPSYFRMFGDHYRLSLAEGMRTIDPALGLSSLRAMAGWSVAVNAALGVMALAWLGWRWFGNASRSGEWVKFLAGAALVALVLGLAPGGRSNAASHPLFPLLQEALLPQVNAGLSARAGDDTPVDARPSSASALAAAAEKIRAASPRPNIVFIVLESVGARPLFPLDAAATPNLAELARSAVVFDSVYAVFPGTARNHAAINTGGQHITWSSVYDVFRHDYTGPVMPRVFGAAGYTTALFSGERLDGEAMDLFERRLGWGTLYDFARDMKNHTSARILNTWGAREEVLLEVLTPWLDAAQPPFLLSVMNTATHHPYTVPRGYDAPFPATDDRARFRNALHYTDAAIGQLVAMLKARGLYENTIIAVTGDHGEGFGEHPGNFTHKNAIYEENVRTFLLLAHPAVGATISSDRVGASGDIFPTLAALAGVPVAVPGVDLLARNLPARAVFFTKVVFPEQWGLRDGRWKFIETIRERQAELYDLAADPGEQRNVAPSHPDLAVRFSGQCERRYLRADAAYTGQLAGYQAPALQARDVRSYGPKIITASGASPAAEVLWIGDDRERTFAIVWQAPDGTRIPVPQKLAVDESKTRTPCPAPLPLARGEWAVSVEEDGRELLRSSFSAR